MNDIVLVGLSHKTAPVEMRERCSVDDPAGVLAGLRGPADEAVLLSTCNRFEVYASGVRDAGELVDWMAGHAGVPREALAGHYYVRRGRNACKHLFFVTSSLDSLVVGETQIRGQVKAAYEAAAEAGAVGPTLHRLFQAALRVSKEIAESTGVGRGNVSVAGAAADLAERVFGDLTPTRVLVIGAGETAELVMHHLASRGVQRFVVLNRTITNARDLAGRFQGDAGGLEEVEARLLEADVLVCAAGAETPLVGAGLLRAALRRRRGRPIVAIDVAVPRGVDPAADGIDNCYRYDMDTLTEVTQDALRHRRSDFIQCCTLIDAATLRLAAETRARRAGRLIVEIEREYRDIADRELAELERRLPTLDEEQRRKVRRMVHRIVRKLLHRPVRALRASDPDEGEVIRRAFATPLPGDDD